MSETRKALKQEDQSAIDAMFAEIDELANIAINKANANAEIEYENLGDLKQGSKAWFHARLGVFTGSKIPDLMKPGRSKADKFGETAKNVIRQVQIERNLTETGRELYVDELFAKDFSHFYSCKIQQL